MVPTVTIRILLADDQESVRVGFRLVLDSQPDMEVVGEASDGLQAVELAARLIHLTSPFTPRFDARFNLRSNPRPTSEN